MTEAHRKSTFPHCCHTISPYRRVWERGKAPFTKMLPYDTEKINCVALESYHK